MMKFFLFLFFLLIIVIIIIIFIIVFVYTQQKKKIEKALRTRIFFSHVRNENKRREFFSHILICCLELYSSTLMLSIKGTYYKYLKHYWTHTYAIWLHWIVCLVLRHALMWFLIHFRISIMYGRRFMASGSEWTWNTRQFLGATMMMMVMSQKLWNLK